METGPDGTLALRSDTLGLELRAAPGREMRFRDRATGRELLSYDEEADAHLAAASRRAAETRATTARTRAAAAEARAATAEARAATGEARIAQLEAQPRGRSR